MTEGQHALVEDERERQVKAQLDYDASPAGRAYARRRQRRHDRQVRRRTRRDRASAAREAMRLRARAETCRARARTARDRVGRGFANVLASEAERDAQTITATLAIPPATTSAAPLLRPREHRPTRRTPSGTRAASGDASGSTGDPPGPAQAGQQSVHHADRWPA